MEIRVRILIRGYNIKRIVAGKNKTIRWLAKRASLSETCLYLVLAGKVDPSPSTRQKIQTALSGSTIDGERVKWDHIFETVESGSATAGCSGGKT